jgi:hypothetical protein
MTLFLCRTAQRTAQALDVQADEQLIAMRDKGF